MKKLLSSKLHMMYISSNHVRHPVTKTFNILVDISLPHLNFTPLHFITVTFDLIPFKFPTTPFHLTSLHFTSLHF
jgi:hypothetical protein